MRRRAVPRLGDRARVVLEQVDGGLQELVGDQLQLSAVVDEGGGHFDYIAPHSPHFLDEGVIHALGSLGLYLVRNILGEGHVGLDHVLVDHAWD